MSGHADYSQFINDINPNINIYDVPIIKATNESIKGYGKFVHDFKNERVINNTWPKEKKLILHEGEYKYTRSVDKNTGNEALPTNGIFKSYYDKNYCYSTNTSVNNGEYIIGVKPNNETKNCIYTREMNYHLCGGQVIKNKDKIPFLLLLSKANDFIKPTDCFLFYFEGDVGFQIYPNIWHQPLYPIINHNNLCITFNSQCSVHSCVTCDFLKEHNTLLRINLIDYLSKL